MSTVTTVIATVIAMFLLDWRLALFALALMPVFVLDDAQGRRAAAQDRDRAAGVDGRHLLARPGVAVGLGDPAREDDGPLEELAERFEGESQRLAGLEVRSRMTGRWMMASIQMMFAFMPAAVYWVGGSRLEGRRDLDRHARRVHDAADAALRADRQPALDLDRRAELARALRPHLRVPRPAASTSRRATREVEALRGDVRFERRLVPLRAATTGRSQGIDVEVPAGTTTAIVGETGAGKTTLGYLVARLYDVTSGCVHDRRRRRARADVRVARRRGRRRLAGDVPLQRERARQPALREAGRDRRGGRGGRARGADPRR